MNKNDQLKRNGQGFRNILHNVYLYTMQLVLEQNVNSTSTAVKNVKNNCLYLTRYADFTQLPGQTMMRDEK